jgi:hypothetical protein
VPKGPMRFAPAPRADDDEDNGCLEGCDVENELAKASCRRKTSRADTARCWWWLQGGLSGCRTGAGGGSDSGS